MISILIFFAVFVVAGLAVYAGWLWSLVKKQTLKASIEKEKADQKRQEQVEFIIESLRVISSNVIDENLNLSEATLRSKKLLDGLLLSEENRAPYQILDVVFEQIKSFDTHQTRHELSTFERNAQDEAREKIEKDHEVALKECFLLLRDFK